MKNLLIILLSILLFSCKDDDEGLIVAGGSSQGNLSVKIKSETFIEDNDTSNARIVNYTYSNNLLTKKVYVDQWGSNDSTTYEYDQSNKLKYIYDVNYRTSMMDTSEVYIYDNQGLLSRVIKYNLYQDIIESEYTFTYSNGKLIRLKENFLDSGSEDYLIKTDSKGNLIEATLNKINGSPTTEKFRIVFTYDNRRNPFEMLPNKISPIWEYICPNNITSARYYEDNVISQTRNYTNTYNALDQISSIQLIEAGRNELRVITYY